MEDHKSLAKGLKDAWESKQFADSVNEEKEAIRTSINQPSYDDLVNSVAILRAYIKRKYTLPGMDEDLITKAFINGRNNQIKIQKMKAQKAAKIRIENDKDEKQSALKAIEQEFKNSTYPFHKRGYKTLFVKEMNKKYPKIESIKTIEKLVAKLSKNTQSAS